jgi:uncharacterized membrane-anchored protein
MDNNQIALLYRQHQHTFGNTAMVNILLRPIMFFAAVISGWFVANDAVNLGVIQMVVALFLITVVVAVAAFWETISDWLGSRAKSSKAE